MVLASQYRGNDGGEGLEQFGGADVGDVVTLVSLASALPYADPKNIFFYGVSRGGMMTFLALARGVAVNAAAVVGGIYDMQGLMEPTKQRMPGVADRVMKLIPDYSTRGAAALAERSVMQWPEKITVPPLMIHGADDEEVPVSQALAFAARLSGVLGSWAAVITMSATTTIRGRRSSRRTCSPASIGRTCSIRRLRGTTSRRCWLLALRGRPRT